MFGWALMLQLVQAVSPSETLEEFVRSFMMRTLHCGKSDPGAEEIMPLAKQCIADMNITGKALRRKGSIDNSGEVEMVDVQVVLIDSSTRRLHTAAASNLMQLGKQVAEQLRVEKAEEFSFFQMIEGVDAHRLLPDTIVLSSLLPKWKKLASATGKVSRLLWKRRFVRVDETLQAGDLMHAKLTYQQALWDYLHYPISEDLAYVCNIAGMVLLSDKDHFARYIEEKTLHQPGVLELLLPDYTLRFEQRQILANSVLKAYQKLQGTCDPGEARLQRTSQVMSLMQRMRLFGTYFWMCKQTFEIPEEKVSLPEAPSQNCKINPKDHKCAYWICVDLFGVRFLSLDSTPGNEYMRGFLLRDESVERVLRWSAKQDILTLIVQTYHQGDKGAPKPGNPVRMPMTITVISSAAIDIAHTLQCAARERK
jgi:hypothetical protein